MARGIVAPLFGAFIVACVGCGGGGAQAAGAAAIPASAPAASAPMPASVPAQIPQADYTAIAQATLPAGSSQSNMDARTALVKQFIASNGGDIIYQNYLTQYGAPPDQRQWYTAQPNSQNTQALGYYYLTHPLTSAADTTYFTCQSSLLKLAGSPSQQAECAMDEWDAYILTSDPGWAQKLKATADGFIAQSVNGQIQWTSTTVPTHGITMAPWISGLTQSVATSVLLRAYQYTGDQKYLAAAQQTYYWLTVPVSQGGIQTSDIGTWLEEYPTQVQGGISSHVLNGNVWALFGVWDYYRVTQDQNALQLFNSDVAAIKSNIGWYDLGYWNVYSHLNRTDAVDGLYMRFITQQMYALYAITADPFFKTYADKWSADQQTDALFVHNLAQAFIRANPTLTTN